MRSLYAVFLGTFTLRFSTGLTGGLLIFYLARLEKDYGGAHVDEVTLATMTALFYVSELVLSTPFGLLSDRIGHHRVMQIGPLFGIIAAILTWASVDLFVIGGTRLLEGASTAASVPSILGFIAMATAGNELLRGQASARFEGATLAGIGAGAVAAGVLYDGIPGMWGGLQRDAFLLNAGFYVVSLLIYRYGIGDPPGEKAAMAGEHTGWRRYWTVLTQLPRLAPRPDLDRDQRGPRAVGDPVAVPADPDARPALRRSGPDGRLRRGPDRARAGGGPDRVLRRARVLG